MSGWVKISIGELLAEGNGSIKTGPFGTALKASEYSAEGVPVISVGEVGYGGLRLRPATPRVNEEVTSRLHEYVLHAGDIVFGRKGAVDRSAWVKPEQEGWFLGSDGIRLRLPSGVDSRFIGYQLTLAATREWLLRHASGSTMLSLNQGTLSRVPLLLPPLAEQRAIAEILGALDDKIEANIRLASSAIEYADRIFPEQSQHSTLQTLEDLVVTTKGVSYRTSDLASGTAALVTLKSFNRNGHYAPGGLKPYVGPFKAEQVISPGEIVVAQTDLTQAADVVGRALRVPKSAQYETLVASLDLAIIRPRPGIDSTYLLGLLRQRSFREHCKAHASGTTVLHLRKGVIETFGTNLANPETQAKYAAAAMPLHRLQDNIATQNKSLEEMRDTLLPELMSGRLRVKDAEMKVNEVI